MSNIRFLAADATRHVLSMVCRTLNINDKKDLHMMSWNYSLNPNWPSITWVKWC